MTELFGYFYIYSFHSKTRNITGDKKSSGTTMSRYKADDHLLRWRFECFLHPYWITTGLHLSKVMFSYECAHWKRKTKTLTLSWGLGNPIRPRPFDHPGGTARSVFSGKIDSRNITWQTKNTNDVHGRQRSVTRAQKWSSSDPGLINNLYKMSDSRAIFNFSHITTCIPEHTVHIKELLLA